MVAQAGRSQPVRRRPAVRLGAAFGIGAAISIALGVYGRVHDPTGHALFTLFFTNTLSMKAWLATVAAVLGIVQVLTALRLYGRVRWPASPPAWLGDAHRLSGTLAFTVSLPVAYHCLWALGFKAHPSQPRVFAHSLLGCAFYGAFAAKVIIVRSKGLPNWALPVAGALLFSVLVAVWATSALWFFTHVGFPDV
jgi:hypothetical protein